MSIPYTYTRRLLALSLASSLALLAAPVSATPAASDDSLPIMIAKNGADNPPGDVRQGRGADNPAGDVRQGRGADNPPADARRSRGTDNPPGDNRRGRGADNPPNHA